MFKHFTKHTNWSTSNTSYYILKYFFILTSKSVLYLIQAQFKVLYISRFQVLDQGSSPNWEFLYLMGPKGEFYIPRAHRKHEWRKRNRDSIFCLLVLKVVRKYLYTSSTEECSTLFFFVIHEFLQKVQRTIGNWSRKTFVLRTNK